MSSARFAATAVAFVPLPPERVWAEVLHPELRSMFGTSLDTDLPAGTPLRFVGHFDGRRLDDHGRLLTMERGHRMHFTHFSPRDGLADAPENYHDIRITLEPVAGGTRVRVVQGNVVSAHQAERATTQWRRALGALAGAEVLGD